MSCSQCCYKVKCSLQPSWGLQARVHWCTPAPGWWSAVPGHAVLGRYLPKRRFQTSSKKPDTARITNSGASPFLHLWQGPGPDTHQKAKCTRLGLWELRDTSEVPFPRMSRHTALARELWDLAKPRRMKCKCKGCYFPSGERAGRVTQWKLIRPRARSTLKDREAPACSG